jgi:hypothetical protein
MDNAGRPADSCRDELSNIGSYRAQGQRLTYGSCAFVLVRMVCGGCRRLSPCDAGLDAGTLFSIDQLSVRYFSLVLNGERSLSHVGIVEVTSVIAHGARGAAGARAGRARAGVPAAVSL